MCRRALGYRLKNVPHTTLNGEQLPQLHSDSKLEHSETSIKSIIFGKLLYQVVQTNPFTELYRLTSTSTARRAPWLPELGCALWWWPRTLKVLQTTQSSRLRRFETTGILCMYTFLIHQISYNTWYWYLANIYIISHINIELTIFFKYAKRCATCNCLMLSAK